jgi:mevalonate kinase
MAHAFGKVILLGEHSVVYGHPALGAAIDRGVTATARLELGPVERSSLRIEPWGREVVATHAPESAHSTGDRLPEAWRALVRMRMGAGKEAGHSVHVQARVDLPPRSGLGCSAALGVALVRAIDDALVRAIDDALVRALDEARGRVLDDQEVADASLTWERVFHGQPSGVDSMLAACGGVLLYTKGQPPVRVRPGAHLPLVVAATGEHSDTREMVDSVRELRQREETRVTGVFAAIESIVLRGRSAVERAELRELGQLMTMNQMLLSSLLLSTPRIEEICAVAQQAGALGAKLTGAGGGGCVVALGPDEAAACAVRDAIQTRGYDAFVTTIVAA